MNAKTELIGRLLGSFSGGDAITEETLADLLKGYTITRESDETRSDLRRRIKYYLGAKKNRRAIRADTQKLQSEPRKFCGEGRKERRENHHRRHSRLHCVP